MTAGLREDDREGLASLHAETDLLLRARAEDAMAGLWEAGDAQWWWKDEERLATTRRTFWTDDRGTAVACLDVAEQGTGQDGNGGVAAELFWLPSWDRVVRAELLPTVMERLVGLAGRGKPVHATARDDDAAFRGLLEGAGFRRNEREDMVQTVQRPERAPEPLPLPEGMRFDDERGREPERAHHLGKRNGEHVAARLRECSLYRRELDLCVRTANGEVAAYCLCWLDVGNGVGLFEPVRTEEAYQRRGIGKALLVEGIRRMMAGGATLIKVTHERENEAATRLYRSVGFEPAFGKLSYKLA